MFLPKPQAPQCSALFCLAHCGLLSRPIMRLRQPALSHKHISGQSPPRSVALTSASRAGTMATSAQPRIGLPWVPWCGLGGRGAVLSFVNTD